MGREPPRQDTAPHRAILVFSSGVYRDSVNWQSPGDCSRSPPDKKANVAREHMPKKNLLWVDCIAGALAGVVVLALSGWLSGVHGLPRELLLFNGTVNL